jgi:hypothetical protein
MKNPGSPMARRPGPYKIGEKQQQSICSASSRLAATESRAQHRSVATTVAEGSAPLEPVGSGTP